MKHHLFFSWSGVQKVEWSDEHREEDVPIQVLNKEFWSSPICSICSWRKEHPFHR